MDAARGDDDRSGGSGVPDQPRVWLCQYLPSRNRVGRWLAEAGPGSVVEWKLPSNQQSPDMKPGDPVIYWRAINPDNRDDRGGIIGVGQVATGGPATDGAMARMPTRITAFFPDYPIPRDEALKAGGIGWKRWNFSVRGLDAEQADRLDILLRDRKKIGLFASPQKADPVAQAAFGRTDPPLWADDPEAAEDRLGRGTIAVAFAWALHDIWRREARRTAFPTRGQAGDGSRGASRRPAGDRPSFTVHIDAPWGGGKTTFVNLVVAVLRAGLAAGLPSSIRARYPRPDGLYLPESHRRPIPEHILTEETPGVLSPWIVVRVNAWQNQHVLPPWWNFYRAIMRDCLRALRLEGRPRLDVRTIRDAELGRDQVDYILSKPGWWSRHWAWFVLYWQEMAFRFQSPTLVRSAVLAVLLGLATLALFQYGWFDAESGAWTKPVAASFVALGAVAAAFRSAMAMLADATMPRDGARTEHHWLGYADPLDRFRKHFAKVTASVRRPILVVVDDLDRCDPGYLVELMRGFQTILRSPSVVYLLLGDRLWIERSFDTVFEKMKADHPGETHEFGGRFVEKAIQLSYRLPGIGPYMDSFVEWVLDPSPERSGGTDADREGDLPEDLGESETTIGPIETSLAETRILDRASRKEEEEAEIVKWLRPIIAFLPANPRSVKRFVNAIGLYQNSLTLAPRGLEAEPGGMLWRAMIICILLLMGYPRFWNVLARRPELADALRQDRRPTEADKDFDFLQSHPAVVQLIRGPISEGAERWNGLTSQDLYALKDVFAIQVRQLHSGRPDVV